jgi:hypothetical protein
VKFGGKSAIPRLIALYYNDDLLCSGTPCKSSFYVESLLRIHFSQNIADSEPSTTIKLEHRLETGIPDPETFEPSVYNESDPPADYFDDRRPLKPHHAQQNFASPNQGSKIIRVCMNLVFNGTHVVDKYFV